MWEIEHLVFCDMKGATCSSRYVLVQEEHIHHHGPKRRGAQKKPTVSTMLIAELKEVNGLNQADR